VTSADAAPHAVAAPPFRIRRLRPEDLPRVLEIESASFSTPWKDATFRSLLLRADCDVFAAERDGALLGYAACWTVLDQAELGNVAVAAEARGQGIGTALVEQVLRTVRARGATECFLEVRVSNQGAQGVYRRLGFAAVGRRRDYYAAPKEDALVMRLDIDPGDA
jgi:ribosomal-protein-alanine N-acetyltransferase